MLFEELRSILQSVVKLKSSENLRNFFSFLNEHGNTLIKNTDELTDSLVLLCAHYMKSVNATGYCIRTRESLAILDLIIGYLHNNLAQYTNGLKTEALKVLLLHEYDSKVPVDSLAQEIIELLNKVASNNSAKDDSKNTEKQLLVSHTVQLSLFDVHEPPTFPSVVSDYAQTVIKKLETNKEICKWINGELSFLRKYFNYIESTGDNIKTLSAMMDNLQDLPQHAKSVDAELSSLNDILDVPIFGQNSLEVVKTLEMCGLGALAVSLSCMLYTTIGQQNASYDECVLRGIGNIFSRSLATVNQVNHLLEKNCAQFIQHNYCAFICKMILDSMLFASPNLKEFFIEYSKSNTLAEATVATLIQPKMLKFSENSQDELLSTLLKFVLTLIEQIKMEFFVETESTEKNISNIDILANYSSHQRYNYIFKEFPTVDLLEILSIILYKRASHLEVSEDKFESCESKVSENQLNLFQDDIISTDSISDDESSSILGALFKEPTLTARENWRVLRTETIPESRRSDFNSLIENTIKIYDILYELSNCHKYKNKSSNRKARVDVLVFAYHEVTKDLNMISKSDGIDSKRAKRIKGLADVLVKYMQALIKNDYFNADSQQYLLEKLNVSPWRDNSNWPLNISPQVLAILIQVLQMKPLQERESASLCIWHKLINTTIEVICSESSLSAPADDINEEHLHILCYIFYSLNLMQKKSILLLTTGALIRGAAALKENLSDSKDYIKSDSTFQILLFSRLVMLLDFIMHYLYTMPKALQDYVDWAIYKLMDVKDCFDTMKEPNEEFYSLCTYSETKNEKKLDGLAWNFLLCTPEKLKYNLLIQILNEILDLPLKSNIKNQNSINQSSLRYAIFTCWNLLLCLPPTIDHLEFQQNEFYTVSDALWRLRFINPSTQIHYFVVNSLIKQGVPTHSVEQMCEDAFNSAMSKDKLKFISGMFEHLIQRFTGDAITFGDLIRLDCLTLHTYCYVTCIDDWKSESIFETIFQNCLRLLQVLKEMYMTDVLLDTPNNVSPVLFRILLEICEPTKIKYLDLSPILTAVGSSFKVERFRNIQITSLLDANKPDLNVEALIIQSAHYHLCDAYKDPNFIASSASLLTCLKNLAQLQHALASFEYDQKVVEKAIMQIIPITTDVTCSFIIDLVKSSCSALRKKTTDDNALNSFLCDSILSKTIEIYHHLLQSYFGPIKENDCQGAIFLILLNFWEKLIQSNINPNIIGKLDAKINENVLFSFVNSNLPQIYGLKLLKVYNKIKESIRPVLIKHKNADHIKTLEEFVSQYNLVFEKWLKHLLYGPIVIIVEKALRSTFDGTDQLNEQKDSKRLLYECADFDKAMSTIKPFFNDQLQDLKSLPFKVDVLVALFQIGTNFFLSYRDKFSISLYMEMLLQIIKDDNVGSTMLFNRVFKWILIAKNSIIYDINTRGQLSPVFVENINTILTQLKIFIFVPDICQASQSYYDDCFGIFNDMCEIDTVIDEEETTQEESDDEMNSVNVCTFVSTQRDFVNQHWYYCYTCKMTDGIGVCSVCAQVCHKNHDISYAKFGNFFCDCGAKEDGSCLALNKFNGNSVQKNTNLAAIRFLKQDKSQQYLKNFEQGTNNQDQKDQSANLVNNDGIAVLFRRLLDTQSTLKFILEVSDDLKDVTVNSFLKSSSLNCYQRARLAITALHNEKKLIIPTEKLLSCIGSTKEGTYENVKTNFSGEHGILIRQLLSSNSVRRAAFCNLTSGYNSRQYLIIAHDKGKIIIYQLTTFLRQLAAEKQMSKWSLVKGNTIVVPCTIISISSCEAAEDVVAICGVRECHIIQVSSMITAKQHKTIIPLLEGSNYIKKCIWLPGSVCLIAVVTAENIQIFDCSIDLLQPKYIFLLPTGKVRECTFARYQHLGEHPLMIFVISSTGHIYFQALNNDCLAINGPFYLTSILENSALVTDTNGNVFGGGFSIYYSHILDLLFASFMNGRSFMITIEKNEMRALLVTDLSANIASKTYVKISNQPLHMWTETIYKPGVIFAMHQHSNNVLAYMIYPTQLLVQEIKTGNHKTKVLDFIVIQQPHCETECYPVMLMVLNDDGSIQIYNVDSKDSNFWHCPQYQSKCKLYDKTKNIAHKVHDTSSVRKEIGSVQTPIDFFERCNQITDVEFGGDELLQIYNTQQLKHRLSTNGLYVACSNPAGFTLTISNLDTSTLITGIRFLFGMQDVNRIPKTITVCGRILTSNTSQCRWFDVPLTMDEIFQEEKIITIVFGPSQDAESIVIIDSIKIYGVSRDHFSTINKGNDEKSFSQNVKYPFSFTVEYDKYHLNTNSFTSILHRYLKLISFLFQKSPERLVEKVAISKVLGSLTNGPLPSTLQDHVYRILDLLSEQDNDLIQKIKMCSISKELSLIIEQQSWYDIDPEKFYNCVVTVYQISVNQNAKQLHLKYHKLYKNIINKILIIIKHSYCITPNSNDPFKVVRPGLLHIEFVLQVIVQLWMLINSGHENYSPNDTNGFLYDCLSGFDSKFRFYTKQALARSVRAKKNIVNEIAHSRTNVGHKVLKLLYTQFDYDQLEILPDQHIIPVMQTFVAVTLVLHTSKDDDKYYLQALVIKLMNFLKFNFSIVFQLDHMKGSNIMKCSMILKFFLMILTSAKSDLCNLSEYNTDGNTKYETTKTLLDIEFLQSCLLAVKTIIRQSRNSDYSSKSRTDVLQTSDSDNPLIFYPFIVNKTLNSDDCNTIIATSTSLNVLEALLRIIYYLIKLSDNLNTEKESFIELKHTLSGILVQRDMSYVRKTIRKTLLILCGSKDAYKLLKDQHFFNLYLKNMLTISDKLHFPKHINEIADGLKNSLEIALVRPGSWQKYCISNPFSLPSLFKATCNTNEEVVHMTTMRLIQAALCNNEKAVSITTETNDQNNFSFKDKFATKLIEDFWIDENIQFCDILREYILRFLIYPCPAVLKNQSHQIINKLIGQSAEINTFLLQVMNNLMHEHINNALTSAHFMDLFSVLIIRNNLNAHALANNAQTTELASSVISKTLNYMDLLIQHPNVHVYSYLHHLLDSDSYYFESEGCGLCNYVELPFTNIKLSTAKADARFTTSTLYIKLVQTYCISHAILRITDIKKTKMLKKLKIYYCNKNIPGIVELKTNVEIWKLAKVVNLDAGQTDIRVEFSTPIVACNLMIEYCEFYTTVVGCTDTIQCPRCSAMVSSNPGMCGNCGENVFQCHKCRAINYDERDPFICNSCGFSKYAKFDYTLIAKPSYHIDDIENDDEYSKVMHNLQSLMEKFDRISRQLQNNKRFIETLLLHTGVKIEKVFTDALNSNFTYINKSLQMITQKYCFDSKNLYEEMYVIQTKILIYKRVIMMYDNNKMFGIKPHQLNYNYTNGNCFKCLLKAIEELLKLLKSISRLSEDVIDMIQPVMLQKILQILSIGTQKWQSGIISNVSFMFNTSPKLVETICTQLKDKMEVLVRSSSPDVNIELSLKPYFLLMESFSNNIAIDAGFKPMLTTLLEILFSCLRCEHPKFVIISMVLKIILNILNVFSNQITFNKSSMDLDFRTWSYDNSAKKRYDDVFLKDKYFYKWCSKVPSIQSKINRNSWIEDIIFNVNSFESRQLATNLMSFIFKLIDSKADFLRNLNSIVFKTSLYPQSSSEFIFFFKTVVCQPPWQQFLVLNGFLEDLLTAVGLELSKMLESEEFVCQFTASDGIALERFIEIFCLFWDDPRIQDNCKMKILHKVLGSYLDIKTITFQRNLRIEHTETKLLKVLEVLTSKKGSDSALFIQACIQILKESPKEDLKTPYFIFEHLYSIVHPEESDIKEFFIILEKDPQQEDFLQGRMLGNPYPSSDSGIGPLMKDIKNKICRECELLALLEDENGMELLVCNKIINLNLPVKDVYKNIWVKEHGNKDAMKIMYRMRGLLGDATEEFVETFDALKNMDENYEKLYFLANFIADNDGLNVVLKYLHKPLCNISLLAIVLKLLLICVKVKKCLMVLCMTQTEAFLKLLENLKECIEDGKNHLTQICDIIEIINSMLTYASNNLEGEEFMQLSDTFGPVGYLETFLNYATSANQLKNTKYFKYLTKIIGGISYGNNDKMKCISSYFGDTLLFEKFDFSHNIQQENKMILFSEIVVNIFPNNTGNLLRDHLYDLGLANQAISYFINGAPSEFVLLLKTNVDCLKKFVLRPSLKYVLKILAGLAENHEATQIKISNEMIPLLHTLEQVSTDEHVGILAENILEILRSNPRTASIVEATRDFTRAEKKRLAMATREKQLNSLGMKANEKGQVILSVNPIQEMEVLKEESGLFCIICREGYNCQPTKILGIYTFSKRTILEDFELQSSRKLIGYTTVTIFNVIHIDCHSAAVRLARGRDEWESASLQNTNTKCNGILPLWGPNIPEPSFVASASRHQAYIRETTQCNEVDFSSCIHDLKLLLLRFSYGKTFHEDSGGGGPQSNMNFIPYSIFYAVYLLLSSNTILAEEKKLDDFLNEKSKYSWVSSSYRVDGPVYFMIASIVLKPFKDWENNKLYYLKRLTVMANTRYFTSNQPLETLDESQRDCLDFKIYKPYFLTWSLIENIYIYFESVTPETDAEWPMQIFNFIRNNDSLLLKNSEKILTYFNENFLPCTTFEEFWDITDLMKDYPEPRDFLKEVLSDLSTQNI